MAVTLKEENTINVNLTSESAINASVPDINYIPGYKIAENERRKNELERVSNEKERIEFYEDLEEKVNSGYFKGEKGEVGPEGPQGPQGEQGPKGEDGETPDLSDYYNKTEIDNMIGDIESVLNEVV